MLIIPNLNQKCSLVLLLSLFETLARRKAYVLAYSERIEHNCRSLKCNLGISALPPNPTNMMVKKPLVIAFLWCLTSGIALSSIIMGGMYLYLSPQLPSVESLRDVRLQTPLRIYSRDGKLIGEFGEQRRNPIEFEDIPPIYIDALLATEDEGFYSHHGVSIKGLMRAASQLLVEGHIKSGGSTITMQVARNFFLSLNQTFARKFNEILLALRIEEELSKEEILELYVNKMFLGNRAYGIQAAAQVYYGKSIHDLSLAQFAMLAGLFKAPSAYNPIVNPKRALIRRNYILGRMAKLSYISQEAYQEAIAEAVTASYHGSQLDYDASYVAEMARKQAIELFGPAAYTDGYRIYTTVDSHMQESAQNAVINGLLTYDGRHGYRGPESSLPLEDLKTITAVDIETETPSLPLGKDPLNQDETDYSQWLKALKDIPTFGKLLPVAVIEIHDQHILVITDEGQVLQVDWEAGLAQAKSYINENTVSSAPQKPADLLQVGDVIRIQQNTAGQWWLKQVPAAQGALVALDPDNGAILSLVGGFDFRQSHFNRATQGRRQPGSNFKPFIYTAALENGFTAATIINDAPIVFEDRQLESTWRPENDGGKFYGPTRLRKALYLSRNLVSIRVLRSMGIGRAVRGMNRFGFAQGNLPRDLSLALGSHAMTPLEIATGYAVFANGGYRVEPYLVDRILDFNGHSVYESLPLTVCRYCSEEDSEQGENMALLTSAITAESPIDNETSTNFPFTFLGDPFEVHFDIKSLLGILEPQDYPQAPKVLDDRVAYIIDSMLRDVIRRGTGTRAKALGRYDLAGKTGTTNGPKDAWFSGYNSDVVATAWLGFDQNYDLGRREYGGSAALPMWIEFMAKALKGKAEKRRSLPEGLVSARIDPETGKRARFDDPDAIYEVFRSENLPGADGDTETSLDPYVSDDLLTEELF